MPLSLVYTNQVSGPICLKLSDLCTLFAYLPASVPSRARILDGTRMPYLYCVRPHERAPRFANVPFRLWMSRRNFDALARAGDQELYFLNSKW